MIGIPTGVFTQVVLVPLLYLPIFWIFGHRDLSQDAKDLTNKANGAGVVLLILLVVIGAPIVEELFFRGFLMGALERTTGKRGPSGSRLCCSAPATSSHSRPSPS